MPKFLKDNNPLISIIVPVYNISKYLPKCVDSILDQSYEHLEIILVDDGSTDDSGGICDEYKERDVRIQVIHKTNGGLSSARNTGLAIMQGQYVGFVDGDDFIHKHMYETLVRAALTTNADVVQTGYHYTDENGHVLDTITFKEAEYHNLDDMFHAFFEDGNIHVGVWTKLYRSAIFTNITFFEGYVFEDYTILPNILKQCTKLVIIDGAFYNYVHNPQSITRTTESSTVIRSRLAAPMHLLNCMADMDPKYIGYAYRYICLSSIRGYDKIKEANIMDKQTNQKYKPKLLNQYRKYFYIYRKEAAFKKQPLLNRISLYLFFIHPDLRHLLLHSSENLIGVSKKIILRALTYFSKRAKSSSSI